MSKTTTLGLVLVAIASMGCLIPSPSLFEEEPPLVDENNSKDDKQGTPDLTITNNKNDGENKDPNNTPDKPYDPPTHDARDNPNRDEYRGRFEVTVSDKDTYTLDGLKLGEATYAFFDFDGLAEDPHCLISLIDQRADDQGRLGYILLKLPVDACQNQATGAQWPIISESERAPANTALLKALQIEQESDRGTSFTGYGNVSGTLTFGNVSSRRMEATLNMQAKTVQVDDEEPRPTNATIDGAFEAVLLNQ